MGICVGRPASLSSATEQYLFKKTPSRSSKVANAPEPIRPSDFTAFPPANADGALLKNAAADLAAKSSTTVSSNSPSEQLPPTLLKRHSTSSGLRQRKPSTQKISSEAVNGLGAEAIGLSLKDAPLPSSTEAIHLAIARLRQMVQLIGDGSSLLDLPLEDVKANLEFSAKVLENVYEEEHRSSSPPSDCDNSAGGSPVHRRHAAGTRADLHRLALPPCTNSRSASPSLSSCDTLFSFAAALKSDRAKGPRSRNRKPRRVNEEDEDELSDVQPSQVPNEVREWLASTFTRKLSVVKRPNEKPKFRSVANAIRAGIFVERIYRRMSSSQVLHIPPKIVMQLRSIDEWTFDVFALNEASNGQALRYVANEVLTRYDLLTKYKISNYALENYMVAVEAGYSKYNNPYHNLIHAADVTQTMHWFLYQTGLAHWLSDLEIFASLIGAIIHDYEHTGTTNNFHVQSRSNLAMLYNDRSVLENFHLSASFALMQKEEHNILANLSKEEYKEFRSLVIDMVLATDMSIHFQQIKNMRTLLGMPENIDKSKALQLVLHSCDISHPAKPWDLHYKFTLGVLEEFFQQGDREQELGLPFSPLCDRQTTVIAQSQIGFIDFIVEPSMAITGDMLEKILKPLQGEDSEDAEPLELLNVVNEARPRTAPPVRSASEGVNAFVHKNNVWRHTAAKASHDIKKPWVQHFQENKVKWREEQVQSDAERRLKGRKDSDKEDSIDANIIHEEEVPDGSASRPLSPKHTK
ncbi:hypothetical protein RvY_00254-2 [Ramazzottius varieornatus]|uniref:Phosphodiesterase n=1 Tax=Ramazzottius varieornatus TaxID=947166 RepID=A0A1D1UG97_RAMVA|nr:hypothetical protein RvY_00254-2 [Ramazzottius varieornatus]